MEIIVEMNEAHQLQHENTLENNIGIFIATTFTA